MQKKLENAMNYRKRKILNRASKELCDVKSHNSPIMALGDVYISQTLVGVYSKD